MVQEAHFINHIHQNRLYIGRLFRNQEKIIEKNLDNFALLVEFCLKILPNLKRRLVSFNLLILTLKNSKKKNVIF